MILDSGIVTLELAGEEHHLDPTLSALTKINRDFGGIVGALQRVRSLDIDAMTAIVAAGTNTAKDAEKKALAEAIFRAGLPNVAAPLAEYLVVLMHGGKPPADDADEAPGKPASA